MRDFRCGAFIKKTVQGCLLLAFFLALGLKTVQLLLPPLTAGLKVTATPLTRQKPEPVGTSLVRKALKDAEKKPFGTMDELARNFYTVDARTRLLEGDLNPQAFLSADLRLSDAQGPKVLIFHTHSTEGFADSTPGEPAEGIWGTGEVLKEALEAYGIACLHLEERFDTVEGKSCLTGAYERMEPVIKQVLNDNPTIEVIIDLHRDGVDENTRLVTEIDGKPCARLMFFNGLCRVVRQGEAVPAPGLENPYLPQNLAFSFQMQQAAEALYPGLCRKTYLNAYRYSLHLLPRSLLVEVGAQTSTKEEAANAMVPLAHLLAGILLGK